MIQYSAYMLTSLLSSVVILVIGICLLTVFLPREPELRNYRISRRFLAGAYIILAAIGFAGVFCDSKIHEDMIVALFQALLYTYALITLLNNNYVTPCRLLRQLLLIFAIVALIIYNSQLRHEPIPALSLISKASYFVLFIYYIWQFFREYRRYKWRVDNFYSGSERQLLRWVKHIYILVIVIGVFAGIITKNNIYFLIFIAAYTLVYVYMGIRYINYVTLFYRITPAVAEPQNGSTNGKEIPAEYIRTAIDQWIGSKAFLSQDISLELLARRLLTNPVYLSRYINKECGQNFRSWINSLRIAEAQKLITENAGLSLAEIGEEVGIPSSSTFYRQFAAVTGMTPAEYRKKFGGGSVGKL